MGKLCRSYLWLPYRSQGFFLSIADISFPLPGRHTRKKSEYKNYSVSNPTTSVQLHTYILYVHQTSGKYTILLFTLHITKWLVRLVLPLAIGVLEPLVNPLGHLPLVIWKKHKLVILEEHKWVISRNTIWWSRRSTNLWSWRSTN